VLLFTINHFAMGMDDHDNKDMNDTSQKIAQLRREYVSHPLGRHSIGDDPIAQFKSWFDEAVRVEQPDPEAMTLSTIAGDGRVSARIVLLRSFDHRGFVFFTNYESRKARELTANSQAALTFYWFALNRQVRIDGRAEKLTRQESDDYFQTRPRGSQIGAWASPQSEEVADRAALDRMVAEIEERFRDQPIPCPPFWGGFRLKPEMIEFWQGRESRLHDRMLYTLRDGTWGISRLAP
jgi:pyridoxamine 5'-phosphate oxidase